MTYDPAATSARFAAALSSGEPQEVAWALRELREGPSSAHVPLAPPDPDVLEAFPDGAPWEVVRDYIWVLAHYPAFVPRLSPDEVVRRWTEAVVRQADSAAALQVILYLKDLALPGADIPYVIEYLAKRGIQPGREADGAEHLARHLLDHSQTYASTVKALGSWIGRPVLGEILGNVAPYVRPEDRGRLGLSADG